MLLFAMSARWKSNEGTIRFVLHVHYSLYGASLTDLSWVARIEPKNSMSGGSAVYWQAMLLAAPCRHI